MPRESTVTDKEVLQVMKELEVDGVKVTTRSVRAKIGRGSATTIAKIMGEVKRNGVKTEATIEIPPHVESALKAALLQQRQSVEAPLLDELESLKQTMGDVLAESERRQEEIDAAENKVSTLESSNADLCGRLDESRREAMEAEARHIAQLSDAKKEIERYREENATLRIQLAQANLQIQDIPETKERLDALVAENKEVLTRATNAERDLAASKARLEGKGLEAERAGSDLSESRKEAQRLATELQEARLSLRSCEIRLEQAHTDIDKLKFQAEQVLQKPKLSSKKEDHKDGGKT